MDGQIVGLREPFQSDEGFVDYPPLHPNCFPGDTLVASRDRVTAQSERWYDGELCIIRTAGGKELTTTPNHPILTDGGWVAAGAVDESHQLVCDRFGERMGATNHDDRLMPTRIEQVADTLWQAGEMATREMPVTTEDFHGDGEGSQVAIIRANRLLWDDANASRREPFLHPSFIGRVDTSQPLDRERLFTESFERDGSAAHRIVCRCHLPLALRRGHPAPLYALGVALAAERYTPFTQSHVNDASADAISFGKLIRRYPGEIIRDNVIHVKRKRFAGHVYTLETDTGYYIADGIVVKNCRCAIGIAPEES